MVLRIENYLLSEITEGVMLSRVRFEILQVIIFSIAYECAACPSLLISKPWTLCFSILMIISFLFTHEPNLLIPLTIILLLSFQAVHFVKSYTAFLMIGCLFRFHLNKGIGWHLQRLPYQTAGRLWHCFRSFNGASG